MKPTEIKDPRQSKSSPAPHSKHWFMFINRRLNALPVTTVKVGLLVTGVFMAVVCLTMILRPIGDERTAPALWRGNMVLPDIHGQKDAGETKRRRHEEYRRIVRLRNALDNLAKSNKERQRYDSLMTARPGLRDSLNAFIEYYQLHFLH